LSEAVSTSGVAPGPFSIRPYSRTDQDACLAIFDSNLPQYFTLSERSLFERLLDNLPGPFQVLEDAEGTVLACGGYGPGLDRYDMEWELR
jgi:hypothetical protein